MSVEPKPQRLINAIGGTGTADDYPLAWVPLRWLHVFRIETANYSGTVDIQGRFREDDSWENVPYVSRVAATASYAAPSVAQISFSASTAVAFVATVEPREFLRLHVDPGGGNAGTITVDVIGTDDDAVLSALWAGSTGVISGTVTADQGTAGSEAWPVTEAPADSIGDGRKTVTTVGTREALASSTPCNSVYITALAANTGTVVVGGSTVVASASTRRGTPLLALQSMYLSIDDLSKVFLDVTVNGEGVSYTYLGVS